MGKPFTHTTWQVKPGREEEFVTRWREWAEWSHRQGLGARARLLRDLESPGTVVSFGPWETIASVRRWRGDPGHHERVPRPQELGVGGDAARRARRRRHRHRERQVAGLQPAGAERTRAGAEAASALPLPDEGADTGSAPLVDGAEGAADPGGDLRRGHRRRAPLAD